MIKSKDEIISMISQRIGEDNSDEAIGLLEDITDTLNDYEDITLGLLFVPETYDTVIQSIMQLADSRIMDVGKKHNK